MFGMGGSEIIVILIVALLFLGPDKLPQAAKSISKGIRDIKKQSRSLQQQIESDEQIGGAIRDLKSALRGDELPRTPIKPPRTSKQLAEGAAAGAGVVTAAEAVTPSEATTAAASAPPAEDGLGPVAPLAPVSALTLPSTAGEADPDAAGGADGDDDLASLVKPASGTVAKGT